MRKMAFLCLIVALGALLAACEKEVAEMRLPESDPKLVVHCFISPQDDYLTAIVSQSIPLLGPAVQVDTLVKDATVTLSDGLRSVQLPYNEDRKAYAYRVWTGGNDELKIRPGRSYTLQVISPRGEMLTAACTVPAAFGTAILVSPDSVWNAYYGRYDYRMRVVWPDPAHQVNYYRVVGHAEAVTEQNSDGQPLASTIARAEWEAADFITDAGRDGELLVSPWGNCRVNAPAPYISCMLYASALHTDEHYYRYHRSVQRAEQSQANPFAEPVLVYSNIEGGLGIFAAFTKSSQAVRVK